MGHQAVLDNSNTDALLVDSSACLPGITSSVRGPAPLCSCSPACVPAVKPRHTCCSDASNTGTCAAVGLTGPCSITLSLGQRSVSWARCGLQVARHDTVSGAGERDRFFGVTPLVNTSSDCN